MKLKCTAAMLVSVLFCPAAFLLLWLAAPDASVQSLILVVGYPLLAALYFLIAGGIFRKKLGLRRITLWLWMLLPGYLLCCALLLLWQPELLQSGDILISLFQLLLLQTPVWLVVWLGLWIAGLTRSSEVWDRAKMRVKRFLIAACRGAAPFLAIGMLFFAAAAIQMYLEVAPAEDYVDEGVHTFTASSGYSAARRGHWQKKHHRWSTRYVYVVIYKAPGGWRWEPEFLVRAEGEEVVQNRDQVDRRVLSIAGENSYITVSPELTARQYVEQTRRKYLILGGICLAIPAAEGVIWLLARRKHAKSP